MAPFRFRLEQVRLYRKQLEEQAMQALAAAVMHRDAIVERIGRIRNAIDEQQVRLCRPEGMSAAERWLAQSYITALKADLAVANRERKKAEEHVDTCRVDLINKAKDRGLLDSLKEKQAARHLLEERQQEQRNNDETATLRYKPATI